MEIQSRDGVEMVISMLHALLMKVPDKVITTTEMNMTKIGVIVRIITEIYIMMTKRSPIDDI